MTASTASGQPDWSGVRRRPLRPGEWVRLVDAKGRLLAGPELDGAGIPVTEPGGTTLGHVTGPHAAATAETLSALVRFEQERRELADEVLDMYREVFPDRMPYYAEHVRRYMSERYALSSEGLRVETAAALEAA